MEYNDNTPSCLMLAVNLEAPVSLGSIFETEDLYGSGVNLDSHITLLYSHTYIDKSTILGSIDKITSSNEFFTSMPDVFSMSHFLETQNRIKPKSVFDLFDLGVFNNSNSDFIILKLKKSTGIFKILETINKGLSTIYNVKSDFDSYSPHITLAEIKSGLSSKYINNETLQLMLSDSLVGFEDLLFGYTRDDGKYEVYDLTHNNSVDRFFRLEDLRKEYQEIK